VHLAINKLKGVQPKYGIPKDSLDLMAWPWLQARHVLSILPSGTEEECSAALSPVRLLSLELHRTTNKTPMSGVLGKPLVLI